MPKWLEERFPPIDEVHARLGELFPDGIDRRPWLTNMNAARTVFVMLYVLAVEGNDRCVSPKVVIEMSQRQIVRTTLAERNAYLARIVRPGQNAEVNGLERAAFQLDLPVGSHVGGWPSGRRRRS